jgi:(4S)-4-hydroxy-5-phosphonooxypentane-2,3-dione isomerase
MKKENRHVVILANYEVAANKLPAVLQLIKEVQTLSSDEPGCLFYRAHQQEGERGNIVFYEIYEDESAFESHRQSRHFQEIVLRDILPLLSSRSVTRLNPIQ